MDQADLNATAQKWLESLLRPVETEEAFPVPENIDSGSQDLGVVLERFRQTMKLAESPKTSLRAGGTHLAVLARGLAAYLNVSLDNKEAERVGRLLNQQTTKWIQDIMKLSCIKLNALYHDDYKDGMLRALHLALTRTYHKFPVMGVTATTDRPPVVYVGDSGLPIDCFHICTRLGLPLSTVSIVPCKFERGFPHVMDVSVLERKLAEHEDGGRQPLFVVAYAGTPLAGHIEDLRKLKELCMQYDMWLHVQGHALSSLCLPVEESRVQMARIADSLTLCPGTWFGLLGSPWVTVHRVPTVVEVETIPTSANKFPPEGMELEEEAIPLPNISWNALQPQGVARLLALPLWLGLQYLGSKTLIETVTYCNNLTEHMITKLEEVPGVKRFGVPDHKSYVVLFKYYGGGEVSYFEVARSFGVEEKEAEPITFSSTAETEREPTAKSGEELQEEGEGEGEGGRDKEGKGEGEGEEKGEGEGERKEAEGKENREGEGERKEAEGKESGEGEGERKEAEEGEKRDKEGEEREDQDGGEREDEGGGEGTEERGGGESEQKEEVEGGERPHSEEDQSLAPGESQSPAAPAQSPPSTLPLPPSTPPLPPTTLLVDPLPIPTANIANMMIAKDLYHLFPKVGITTLKLPKDGICFKFDPINSFPEQSTSIEDVDEFVAALIEKVLSLHSTSLLRCLIETTLKGLPNLRCLEFPSFFAGGFLQFVPTDWASKVELTLEEVNKLNKLNIELAAELATKNSAYTPFQHGNFTCIMIKEIPANTDISNFITELLTETRKFEDQKKFLEGMSEKVLKGIEEAQTDLSKEKQKQEEEQGFLRNIPVVGSLFNWFAPPTPTTPKGRSFNLNLGKVQTTSETYKHRMQVNQDTSLTPLPTGSTPTTDDSTTTTIGPPLDDQTKNQTKEEDQTKADHCEPQQSSETEVGVGVEVANSEEGQEETIKTEGE